MPLQRQTSRAADIWSLLNDPWIPGTQVLRGVSGVFALFMALLIVFRESTAAQQGVLIGRASFVAYGIIGAIFATRMHLYLLRLYMAALSVALPIFALYVSFVSDSAPIALGFQGLAIICPMVFLVTIFDLILVVVALFLSHLIFLAASAEPALGVNNQWLLWTSMVAIAAMASLSLLLYRLRLRHSERELILARDEALRESQQKSELLANRSDEIRTPLNGILGLVDLLLDTRLSPEQRRYLEMVASDTERLTLLLNDILDLSKIHAQQLSLKTETFNLPDLLRATLTPRALQAEEKGVDLVWETSNRLPVWVKGDPVRLRQVMSHLVDNAIRTTERGEISIIVKRAPRRQGREQIQFSVRDTGAGIDNDALTAIRQTLAEIDDKTANPPDHSGLRLVVCANLVKIMHGRIDVTSDASGSEFTFTARLPADRIKQEQWANRTARGLAGGAQTLNVLLVEDNATNRIFAERVLQKAGHNVVTAENGQVGLEEFGKREFDIVFMDMTMPVMDGVAAAKAIRKREAEEASGAHVPIVALTAHALEEQKQRCLDAGMDMHLVKPVHGSDLLDILYQMVALAEEDEDFDTSGEHRQAQAPRTTRRRTASISHPRIQIAPAPEKIRPAPSRPVPANPAPAKSKPAPAKSATIFNADRLLEMLDGDRELITEMLTEFDSQQKEIATDLKKALDEGNSDRGGKLAHKLKGSLLALCADASAEVAKTLEHALRAGDLEQGRKSYPMLLEQLAKLMDELRRQKFVR